MKLYSKWEQFKHSFKDPKLIFKTFLYDAIFYILVFPIMFTNTTNFIDSLVSKIDFAAIESATEVSEAAAANALHFFTILGLVYLLVFILSLMLWSLSAGLIYTAILKKKFSQSLFFKLIGMNLIYSVLAFILIITFGTLAEATQSMLIIYLFIIVATLVIYFIAISYIELVKTNTVFRSIANSIIFGGENLRKLFIPVVIAIIGIVLISVLNYLIVNYMISTYVIAAIAIVSIAWLRIYFVQSLEGIKNV